MTSAEHIKDEHDWVAGHLTDCLTGRADTAVAARMQKHLANCVACAGHWEIERRIQEHIRTPATVEYTPGASFAKLKARLAETPVTSVEPPQRGWRFRRLAMPLSLAASLTALAISLVSLTARHTPAGEVQFQTLSRTSQAQGDLHIGFSDETSALEIERALLLVNGRIISGPSPAGVYRVAVGGAFSAPKAIEILARQKAVRFVTPAPEAADD